MIPAPMNTDSLVRLRLADERKTAQLARALAARAQAGDCLLLQGDLGATREVVVQPLDPARTRLAMVVVAQAQSGPEHVVI